jgi:hypothetical protein
MTCPKCGQTGVTEPSCPRCGVVFAKLKAPPAESGAVLAPAPISTPPSGGWPLWVKVILTAILVPLGTFAALLIIIIGLCMT